MQTLSRSFLMLVSLLILGACTQEETPIKDVSASDTYFPISIDDVPLRLQLALTPNEQSKGLMHRDSLPEDHGMLFLFKQPGQRSFWMRNTRIPLDLSYFDASGRLLEIHSLYPYNENAVHSHSQQVIIAVETNQGWFQRKQIQPGAQLDLNALKQALKYRGHSPLDYPLEISSQP